MKKNKVAKTPQKPGEKRGRGRPPLAGGDVVRRTVVLTPAVAARVDQRAAETGETRTALMRRLIAEGLRR